MESTKKPKWLKALEKQSWQTELVASGLAIYGSLELGPVIDRLVEYCAIEFNHSQLELLYYGIMYLYICQVILVGAFIFHLCLRILWAAFLGLSSVHPEGINVENKSFARDFLVDLKNELPNLTNYSIELDNVCSKIFSSLCSIVLIFFSFTLWIFIIMLVSTLIYKFTGVDVSQALGLAFMTFIMVLSILQSFLSSGSIKNKPWAIKYTIKSNYILSKIFFLIGSTPINLISWTQRTNSTTSKYIIQIFLILFLALYFTGDQIKYSASVLMPKHYAAMNEHPARATANNYEDVFTQHKIIMPLIQSRYIDANYIELFIPELEREKEELKRVCGTNPADSISRFDFDKSSRAKDYQFKESCADQFFKVKINGQEVKESSFKYRTHKMNGQKGFMKFIDVTYLPNGEHELQIELPTKNENNEKLERTIPFLKTNSTHFHNSKEPTSAQ